MYVCVGFFPPKYCCSGPTPSVNGSHIHNDDQRNQTPRVDIAEIPMLAVKIPAGHTDWEREGEPLVKL